MNNKLFETLFYVISLFSLSAWALNCDKTVKSALMIVDGYEWGPAVPKVVVEFDSIVTGVRKDTFSIKTADVEREIIDVYSSNKNGEKNLLPSKFVTFELEVDTVFVDFLGVNFGNASPFSYDYESGLNSWVTSFDLELKLVENKTFNIGICQFGKEHEFKPYTYNLAENFIIPGTAEWRKDSFTHNGITLQRASFAPKKAKIDLVKNPLIVWLHGAGEGGKDIDIALLGNEVTALTKNPIQKYFSNIKQQGAYVLAVQTPTMWMDKGNGQYNDDLDGERQYSIYEDALFAAIKDYVENNDDIDTDRIYLGGCSNGGYMTMNMMFEHGDFFTAFYPICEAYRDRNISEEMITRVKDYNIWFVQSEDDTTVDPLSFTIPSFYRLIKAGAKNVHFTLKDHVRGHDDPSALYFGHYAWTYAFNDDVKTEFDNAKVLDDFSNVVINGGNVTSTDNYVTAKNCNKEGNMWTWLAEQTKN